MPFFVHGPSKINAMKLNFHSGGRCDWHHRQAPHGNMDWHAEWQNGKFQVHLCGCANRGESWYTQGHTNPQSETEINCPGSVKAPQFGGIVILYVCWTDLNVATTVFHTTWCSFTFWMVCCFRVSPGVFLVSAAERLPNSRWFDEAKGASPDGAECDWSRAQASSARRCRLPAATALWVMGKPEKVIQGQCHRAHFSDVCLKWRKMRWDVWIQKGKGTSDIAPHTAKTGRVSGSQLKRLRITG